jgi:hypothetical protein
MSVLQISSIVSFLSLYNAFAICTFFLVSDFGRPPLRPLALAAVRPACVRSRMMSRSNSAKAPKIWKISFPPEVVVSIASVIDLKPIFRLLRPVIVSMRCLRDRPSLSRRQTQGITRTDVVEGFVESRALRFCAACSVGEDSAAACLFQGVFLEIEGLVCG